MILFTQSTVVLHKYLNDKLKILCLLHFFPEAAQNSLSFPCSEKSLSIPGLWPPCVMVAWAALSPTSRELPSCDNNHVPDLETA